MMNKSEIEFLSKYSIFEQFNGIIWRKLKEENLD